MAECNADSNSSLIHSLPDAVFILSKHEPGDQILPAVANQARMLEDTEMKSIKAGYIGVDHY